MTTQDKSIIEQIKEIQKKMKRLFLQFKQTEQLKYLDDYLTLVDVRIKLNDIERKRTKDFLENIRANLRIGKARRAKARRKCMKLLQGFL
ncbi:hypothetical protein KJ969_01550 [Patescibacteria group bacterium]|nr:hypothetical protein [Patescibacteria group bacterium]MBU1922141.1 hypothetical protein [Patescibacteria group bacterium]